MGLPASKQQYTVIEYLALELDATDKHEFHDGEILAMSGGTYRSSVIAANLIRRLGNALDGTPCGVSDSNSRVLIASLNRYVYPDLLIVCGAPEFDPLDIKQHTIMNPRVVVEVLSPSTEAYDRGEKFNAYRDVPSLEEYILIAQDQANVESWLRQPAGDWTHAAFKTLEAIAKIRCLGIEIPLTDIYARIQL